MTYDFHGSWERNTGENSPLFPGPADSGDYKYFNVVSVPTGASQLSDPGWLPRGDFEEFILQILAKTRAGLVSCRNTP